MGAQEIVANTNTTNTNRASRGCPFGLVTRAVFDRICLVVRYAWSDS